MRSIHLYKESDFLIKRWFNKILINTAIDHLRRQSKIIARSAALPRYHVDDFSQLEFEDLLDVLPDSERQIVSLRFRHKYDLKEIAATLGMNENTVKTQLYRALKRLKLEITGEAVSVAVKKDKNAVRNILGAFVAALLSATLIFNLSPTLSTAAYDIPIIGDIIRVITFNRFSYHEGTYNSEMDVPQIQGLLNPDVQERLNEELRENADLYIRTLEQMILEFEESGEEPPHMSYFSEYNILADNDRVLSLDTTIFSNTNAFYVRKLYTIDKKASQLVTLDSLFKPDADFITPVSAYIVEEMNRRNREDGDKYCTESYPELGSVFTSIRSDQSFYINSSGELVICFDKHEVAPGAYGTPEFVIPYDVIKEVCSSDLIS